MTYDKVVGSDRRDDRGETIVLDKTPADRTQPDTNRFFAGPDGDACQKFLARYEHLAVSGTEPLYAMPPELIGAIAEFVPGWLTADELHFERDLAEFCRRCAWAAGIVQGNTVPAAPLPIPLPPAYPGNQGEQEALRLLSPLLDQRQAYAGWLLTNPLFVAERDRIREHRTQRRSWRSFVEMPDDKPDPTFKEFLSRWSLGGFSCWDLPVPQGPDLTSIGLPRSRSSTDIRFEIPVTVGLPEKYPQRLIIENFRRQKAPPHLLEWVNVLQRRGQGKGVSHYQQILPLHFYYNLALRPRYGQRFRRHVEQLDQAFGDYFGRGEDLIKKLRSQIARRLRRRVE